MGREREPRRNDAVGGTLLTMCCLSVFCLSVFCTVALLPITFADVSRARAKLGYNPRVRIAQGIPLFVEWFLRQPKGS